MTNNLIAELVKIGIPATGAAKAIAAVINKSEKTARNKINGSTEWTLPEAMAVNSVFFAGNQSLEYLFRDGTGDADCHIAASGSSQ